MMLSLVANVGAEVLNLAPEYAKPGDTIDILSWNIVGPTGGVYLQKINIGYKGDDVNDVLWANVYVNYDIYQTLYGPEGFMIKDHYIPEGETAIVKLEFQLRDTAVHGNHVDGYIIDFALSKPGGSGTDPKPIDPIGYTIIDAEKPTVKSVTVVPNPAIEGGVTVTVEFSEGPMDNSVNPKVTVEGLSSSYNVDKDSYSGNIWIGTFILEDEGDLTHGHISVSDGQDLAGNVMVAEPEAGTFAVDTKEPTVTIGVSDTMITEADSTFKVTATFSEAMDTGVNPTISFDQDVHLTLTLSSDVWSLSDTVYTATYTVADADAEVSGVGVTVEGGYDLAGNIQELATVLDAFSIDTVKPTVDSAKAVPDPAKAGTVTVTVEFSEDMNPIVGLGPTVDVTGLKSSYTVSGIYLDLNTWEGTFDLIDEDEVDTAYISVIDGQDLAGNVMLAEPKAGTFAVDTINPMMKAYGVSHLLINKANVGDTFWVQVGYNEIMNTLVTPSVSFNKDVSGTLSPTGGTWMKVGSDDYYRATYLIEGGDQEVDDVDTTWTGAKDLAGNTQVPFTSSYPFDIDTKAPIITSFIRSDPVITEADIPGPFYISLGFSEPITPIILPEAIISFTPDVTGTLSFDYFVWDPLNSPLNFQVVYVISDGNQETNVDTHVDGFVDGAGNPLVPDTFEDKFYIDNLKPTVTITIDDPINLANVEAVPVTITSDENGDYDYDISDGTAHVTGSGVYTGTPISLSLNLNSLSDGTVTADASVVDAVGNVGHAPQAEAYKDATAPTPYSIDISLLTDADGNVIANIGDTMRVRADMMGHPDTVSVTADLRAYGGSEFEVLTENVGVWSVDFVIVDSSPGIDVEAGEPASAVTVTATDDVGNTAIETSAALDKAVDSHAPEPPIDVEAKAVAEGKIQLDWTASSALDLGSYNIYRDTEPGPTVLVATGVTGTTWTEPDPLAEAEYYYRMKSVDDADNIGAYSEEASATSDSTPPDAPTGLYAPDYINIANQFDYPVSGTAEFGSWVDVRLANRPLPKIDGFIDTGEWDGAMSMTVWRPTPDGTDIMGTVKVLATTDYLYMLFDVVDPTDARQGQQVGNDKIAVNINPTEGAPWGMPCDIIFEMGTDPASWPIGPSCGSIDGYETNWVIDGVQQPLPSDLLAKTIYSAPDQRITELSIPLATAGLLLGDTITLGGGCDNLGNTGNCYRYPLGLDWNDVSTYADLILDIKTVTGHGPSDGGFYIEVDASILDEGTVYIDSRATDTVGNTGPWSDPITVIKDTFAPTVTIDIPEYINLANVYNVPVTITSDEAGICDYVISDGVDTVSGSWSIVAGAPSDLFLSLGTLDDGIITADASVEDAAGNVGHAPKDTATKDTEVSIVTIDIPEYINLANVYNVPVTITSDEAGDYSYDISGVTGDGDILANTPISFDLDLSSLLDGTVTADASVEDAAGNVGHATKDSAIKDTDAPIVTGLTASPILLTDAEEGSNAFTVTVDYSEAMKGVPPTITFDSTSDSTLDFTGGSWKDDDTYVATYDVADAGVTVDDVNILVEDAEDLAGNVQVEYTKSDAFDIDTENPTVIDLEISDLWIREDDIPGSFTVTVTFSEAMSVAPTISFSEDIYSTLEFDSDDWSVDDTVYTATYTIVDVDEYVSGVVITVEGAEDIAGNLQVQYVTDPLFDVDTLHGTSEPESIVVKANSEDDLTVTIVDEVKLVATVINYFGEPIPDGVEVSFATDLGTIYPLIVTTAGGSSETSIFSTDLGTANVIATAGGVSDSCTITFVEQTIEIKLSLGWNLISVPRTLAEPAIEDVFAGITTIEKVWTYQDGEWYGTKYEGGTWVPIPDHLLEEIDDGKGYWVYTSESKTITIKLKPLEYMATPPSYLLPSEWSLVGYTSIQLDAHMPVDAYLSYLTWNTLYRFNPSTRMYEIAKPTEPIHGFQEFELGRGYWIYLSAGDELVP